MCLIAFRWQPQSSQPLVLAANRDEFHARPTRPLGWWQWPGGPLAGRDLKAGGTWMAVARNGRYAAVTNFRDVDAGPGSRSRGDLPVAWLECDDPADVFARRLYRQREDYAPFNLLLGDQGRLWIVGTHAEPAPVSAGIHALSNHLIDTPWPKSIRAVRLLEQWLEAGGNRFSEDIDGLLDLLDDREPADTDDLPDTGIGPQIEKLLSAPFIVSPDYGTRSSSALIVGATMRMAERSFDRAGGIIGQRHFTFRPGVANRVATKAGSCSAMD
ncbi:MAG: NRDE family protein [Wenzhouxiangellaceae bacterium]|nr:NRDE family protein [Wenzhouxiangellaceae bacterium]